MIACSETGARVNDVASQMRTSACLFHSILRHTDNNTTLKSIRSVEMFKLFWQKTVKQADQLDIGQPALPNAPRCLEVGTSAGSSPTSPEDHYRAIYFEDVDTVSTCIGDRFKQEGYQN